MSSQTLDSEPDTKELVRTLDELVHIENFENNKQNVTNLLNVLYLQPLRNRDLYYIPQLYESSFLEVLSQNLALNYKLDSAERNDTSRRNFYLMCMIIVTHADENIEFRKNAAHSSLPQTLTNIISDSANYVSRSKSINFAIRALYNVTRLTDKVEYFRKFKIVTHLLRIIDKIECERTRVCAVMCLGWTMNQYDIEKIARSINQTTFNVILSYAFSLLDRAIQSGNSNGQTAYCCFLKEYGKLPYFWGYEIAEGIARLAMNEEIRECVSRNPDMFKLLVQLYLNGNKIEKVAAGYAICVFSLNETIVMMIKENEKLLDCMKIDHAIDSDDLKFYLTEIMFRVLFHRDLNSTQYLQLEYNLIKTVSNSASIEYAFESLLNKIKLAYEMHFHENSIHYKNYHDCFIRELADNVCKSSRFHNTDTLEERENVLINKLRMNIIFFINQLIKNVYSDKFLSIENVENLPKSSISVVKEYSGYFDSDIQLSVQETCESKSRKRCFNEFELQKNIFNKNFYAIASRIKSTSIQKRILSIIKSIEDEFKVFIELNSIENASASKKPCVH